ncbi:helix-turn-helix domain-containing protein [Ignicoccus hospitalis]|uniref:helix-turn-helix domain-containing protein n=1 Tax=Ignicoccus hospitalis TaxID=160233 RepID=UPI0011D08F2C|nr:helix-turn-helix domain-containing protein [Ignicoccus hospitalis]HIH90735.1 helix-turn-helix domain-containing protein [Desulfurococcaceae archaeon]
MSLRKDLVRIVEKYKYIENGKVSDVVVRSNDDVFVVLGVENSAKVSKRKVGTLTMLAKGIGAKPLLVAKKSGDEELLEDVVYEKYGVAVVNLETFENILKGNKIYIRKKKSIFTVSIDSKRLKELCEEMGISMGELANYLGVSRKSVYDYIRGNKDVSVDTAIRLAELVGDEVLKPVNLEEFQGIELKVEPHTPLERELMEVTDSIHVPKGNVSVGGEARGVKFTAVVPHGDEELEWFAELSEIIDRMSVAVGYSDVPKTLENSKVKVTENLQQFLEALSGEPVEPEGDICSTDRGRHKGSQGN